MIDNYFGDRNRQRNVPYENRNRIVKEKTEPETVYVCLDKIVNPNGFIEKPTTHFGIGNLEKIKELGAKYEKKKRSHVMLTFYDDTYDTTTIAKVYISDDHEEMDNNILGYIDMLKSTIAENMKKDKPNSDLGIVVSVHYCNDNAILNKIKKNVRAEEIVSYEY